MEPGKQYHRNIAHVIRNYLEERLKGRQDIDPYRIFITHTRCDPKTVNTVLGKIRAYAPEMREILETTAGAAITTHCGPNTLGILFVRRESLI